MNCSFNIEKLAELARLDVTKEEVPALVGYLNAVLGLVEQMQQEGPVACIKDLEPMTHPHDVSGLLRPDRAEPVSVEVCSLFEKSSRVDQGFFLVPKVIE